MQMMAIMMTVSTTIKSDDDDEDDGSKIITQTKSIRATYRDKFDSINLISLNEWCIWVLLENI